MLIVYSSSQRDPFISCISITLLFSEQFYDAKSMKYKNNKDIYEIQTWLLTNWEKNKYT